MAVAAAIITAAVALAACASVESRLRPEAMIPEMRALGAACDLLPQREFAALAQDEVAGPVRVVLREYGDGSKPRALALVHGVLADQRTWRYLIGGLDGEHDVWALDLPGCGASDKPEVAALAPDAYSPDWLARLTLQALRARLAAADAPPQLTLVGHSLGGGVVLRMLGDPRLRTEFADVLARVDGAVLMAPLDFGYGRADPVFVSLSQVSDVEMLLGSASGVLRRATAEAIYYGGADALRMPSEGVDQLHEILMDPQRRRAGQAMLQRAAPFGSDAKLRWEQAEKLTAQYRDVATPCLLLWGERDETLPAQSGDRLVHELPQAWLRIVPGCKHSLPTEEPRGCVAEIRRFLAEDRASWPEFARVPRPDPAGASELQEQDVLKRAQSDTVSRGRPQPSASAPSSVTVLRGRDLERSGARTLTDALRMAPGVETTRLSSTESGVSFRGYADSATAAQGVLALVDGRQAMNPFFGSVLWDQLLVRGDDIAQVEIVRGPGSFLHGPDAMHGVVSVETRKPLEHATSSSAVTASAGNVGFVETGATVVHRTENTGMKLSGQWDDVDRFGGGVPADDGASRDRAMGDVAYEARIGADPRHVVGLQAGVSAQQFDLLLPSVAGAPPARFDERGREAYTQLRYRRGDPRGNVFTARASWTGFTAESEPSAVYQPFTVDQQVVDGELRWTLLEGDHALTGGVGGRRSSFDTDDADVSDGAHAVDQGWAFAQDDVRLVDGVTATVGARVDEHGTTGTTLSPRGALVWEFVDAHFARASAGRGFRNPSLRELWFDMPLAVPGAPTPVVVRGDRDLAPESLTSYELAYFGSWGPVVDRSPAGLPGARDTAHRFEGGVLGFLNRVDDLISFAATPGATTVVAPRNGADEEAYGVEVEGRYVFSDDFSAFGNHAWTQRRDRATGDRSPFAPEHKSNLGVAWTGSRWEATLWAYRQDAVALFGQDVPSYLLLNGSVSWRFDLNLAAKGRLFLRAFNLLDDEHREHPEGDLMGLLFSVGVQIAW
jgi:iron complex outermembrane receptor protein